MKYLVIKTFQYTEEVEVDSGSEREACDLATSMDGDRIYDDHLYDCKAKELQETK